MELSADAQRHTFPPRPEPVSTHRAIPQGRMSNVTRFALLTLPSRPSSRMSNNVRMLLRVSLASWSFTISGKVQFV